MKKYHYLVLFSLFITIPAVFASELNKASGEQLVLTLSRYYDDAIQNCGSSQEPAFKCSGITLRATETNPSFFPWNPSPGSQTRGGVSFSWLRIDSNFSRSAYHYPNGFIIYPEHFTPQGKITFSAQCYFPIDGDTINRPLLAGCGANTYFPTDSTICSELSPGTNTTGGWLKHYEQVQNSNGGIQRRRHQCAFDIRSNRNVISGISFYSGVEARGSLSAEDQTIQNELVLSVWEQNIPGQLPIMAFYYLGEISGESIGLNNARNDQKRFYAQTAGQVVPIVKITLPTSFLGVATFTYSDTDQAVK